MIPAVMVGMDKTVTQLAKEKTAADKAFGEAFRAHLRTFKPLDIDQFWGVITQLRKNLQGDRGVKAAIHNLFCAFLRVGGRRGLAHRAAPSMGGNGSLPRSLRAGQLHVEQEVLRDAALRPFRRWLR